MEGQTCPYSSAKLSKVGLETFLVLSSQYKVTFDRPLVENSRHSNPHSLLDQDPGSGEEKQPQAVTALTLHIASVPFGKATHSTSQQYPVMIFQVQPHTSTAMSIYGSHLHIHTLYIVQSWFLFREEKAISYRPHRNNNFSKCSVYHSNSRGQNTSSGLEWRVTRKTVKLLLNVIPVSTCKQVWL